MRKTLIGIVAGLICILLLCWYVSKTAYSQGQKDCSIEILKETQKASEEILRLQADNKNLQKKLAESIENEERFKEILRSKLPASVAQLLNNI